MDRTLALSRLRGHEGALRAAGLREVSIFGSVARGQEADGSDLDLAVKLEDSSRFDLFSFAALTEEVRKLLGVPVDLIVEPSRNRRMQAEIDRDRLRVF